MTILLRTIHGSRLYNLHHAGSDYDYYTVMLEPQRAKHKIAGDQDNMTVDLGTFMKFISKGVPQALEALYSTRPDIDHLGWLRDSFRPAGYRRVYARTIRNFLSEGNDKKDRHAIRLEWNLNDLETYGRFDPTLSEERRAALFSSYPL